MRIVLARAGMWVAMSGYNRDGGTRGRASRNCTLVRRGIRIYEPCWCRGREGKTEIEATIARLFTYAAWADKWDGQVHQTPIRGVTLAMNEPVGVVGVAAPAEYPLLGFISTIVPAIA